MNKKLSIIAVTVMVSVVSAFAEDDFTYKGAARPALNEINLTYGGPTLQDFGALISAGIVSPIAGKITEAKAFGALNLEYMRYLETGRFAFGGALGFEAMEGKYENGTTENIFCLFVMPSAKAVWFNRKHFGMYSHVALGVWTMDKQVNFGFQVNPVGMEFGGQYFRGFVQGGFGNLGIFSAGLRFDF